MSIFSTVPVVRNARHRNHLTPVNTASFNFGGIYPIFTKTVYPHDYWSMSLQSFVRSVPLLSPVMSRNDIKVDAFFVPFRLIWKSAEDWHKCVDDTIRRPKMYVKASLGDQQKTIVYNHFFGESSLNDYFGFGSIPASWFSSEGVSLEDRKVCALPYRAYMFIYDYYFRNKSIEPEITVDFPDFYGDNDHELTASDMTAHLFGGLKVLNRSWRRDIFTSALPDPQEGSDILIPQADIVADGVLELANSGTVQSGEVRISSGSGSLLRSGNTGSSNPIQEYKSGLKLDPTGPTIRKLRFASYLEEFEEAQARGGSAKGFKEWLKNIWNVNSSDARLDRPEYLGGYRGPIQISEVPQTSAATNTSAQGTLAGKGLSVGGSRLFRHHFFEEPGIIMVLMSVVPKSAYCEGDPREWLYESPFDFPNPFFDNLGEQPVFNEELNARAQVKPVSSGREFGYNVRYYEGKSFPDEIHGALRSSLSYWHEGRLFGDSIPGLNEFFLKVNYTDVSRIFPSSESSDKLIGEFFFDIRLKRNLSWYGLPKFG